MSIARVHTRLWAELAARGKVAGAHDLLIAATALAHDASVVARATRGFPRIPGLRVIERR